MNINFGALKIFIVALTVCLATGCIKKDEKSNPGATPPPENKQVSLVEDDSGSTGKSSSPSDKASDDKGTASKDEKKEKPATQATGDKAPKTQKTKLDSEKLSQSFHMLNYIFVRNGYAPINDAKDAAKQKGSLNDNYAQLANQLKGMTLEDFDSLDQYEKIALWINLHNAIAIKSLSDKKTEENFPSFSPNTSKLENTAQFDSFFKKDPFFTAPIFEITSIGKLSLNDITFGILIGDEKYLASVEDSKKKAITEFHGKIEFPDKTDKDTINPEYLFTLFCGVNACPTIGEIANKDGNNFDITADYLKDIDAIHKKVAVFLSDKQRGVTLSDSGIKVPYILKLYEKPLQKRYPSTRDFLTTFADTAAITQILDNAKGQSVSYNTDKDLLDPTKIKGYWNK